MNNCLQCENEIRKGKKFCDNSCAAKYNNKKHPKRTKGRVKPNCPACGKQMKHYHSKYCNNQCQGDYRWKNDTIPRILEGKASHGSCKRYLYETVGAHCSECNTSDVWNGKPLVLQLDHIDGDSDNNCLSNLRLLCPNCHTQTETFTGRNVKNTKRNSYLRRYKNRVQNME